MHGLPSSEEFFRKHKTCCAPPRGTRCLVLCARRNKTHNAFLIEQTLVLSLALETFSFLQEFFIFFFASSAAPKWYNKGPPSKEKEVWGGEEGKVKEQPQLEKAHRAAANTCNMGENRLGNKDESASGG